MSVPLDYSDLLVMTGEFGGATWISCARPERMVQIMCEGDLGLPPRIDLRFWPLAETRLETLLT